MCVLYVDCASAVCLRASFYRYLSLFRGMASSPLGQGPASPAAPISTSSSFAAALVCAHGASAHSPGEAYAEPPDERVGLEYSRSPFDTLAQRDVSPSVDRVFGPGVGPETSTSGLLDHNIHVPAPYGDGDTSPGTEGQVPGQRPEEEGYELL